MIALAASVVLYQPNLDETVSNIKSYAPYFKKIFVIDNSSPAIDITALSEIENIFFLENNFNAGIARALNQACELAIKKGFEWLLTMDQDSSFSSENIIGFLKKFNDHVSDDIAVFNIQHDATAVKHTTHTEEVIAVITSGSLINLAVWKKVGGFNEELFIDEVDHEYCYRVKLIGYRVVLFPSLYLNHSLGKERTAGYLGVLGRSKRRIHNPQRLYFMVRNYLFVRKKYSPKFGTEFKSRDKQVLTTVKNNLFFSGQFFASLRAVIKGYSDHRKLK